MHNAPFSPLIEHAIEFSAQWHDQTYRKGGWRRPPFERLEEIALRVPVMSHLTAVALTVARAGWDDSTIAAAFLHDALEDEDHKGRSLGYQRLHDVMGRDVADLVQYVTEEKLDEGGRLRAWRPRKEGYVERLTNAPDEAIAISAADKLHNLWSINQAMAKGVDVFRASSGRRPLTAGAAEQWWFYSTIRGVIASRRHEGISPILDQLDSELRRFRQFLDGS